MFYFPILQYVVLACASTGKTKLETIEPKIQRLLKNFCFKRRTENTEEISQKRKLYFVKKLHIYEYLKFFC